ncbi:hypothetical protein MCEL_25630 [Mycolicibacterium celeriflavum]|uniref:Uncharacterized protein n=1 Tax=Mycolicibacterium celeriflavum TaxID=1249101 RepID=A0A7I7RI82_MYCCF|nr:hypothetical protein MCEL_25630 [Mycolicibacterium celeriflavum]
MNLLPQFRQDFLAATHTTSDAWFSHHPRTWAVETVSRTLALYVPRSKITGWCGTRQPPGGGLPPLTFGVAEVAARVAALDAELALYGCRIFCAPASAAELVRLAHCTASP